MTLDTDQLTQIQRQLAQILAIYGDEPKELMFKIELLVIEWFYIGLNQTK